MGTEILTCPTQSSGDIKQKINNYQAIFKHDRYNDTIILPNAGLMGSDCYLSQTH